MTCCDPLARLAGRYLGPHRRPLALTAAAAVAGVLLGVAAPLAQGRALDRLTAAALPDALGWAGLAAGCLVARAVVGWRVGAVMARLTQEVVRDLTLALHRAASRLPPRAVERFTTDGLLVRATADVGSVMIFLNTGTVQLAGDLVLGVGAVAAVTWLDWRLVPTLAGPLVVGWASSRRFAGLLAAAAGRVRERVGEVVTGLGERLAAAPVVAAFGRQLREQAAVAAATEAHAAAARRWARLAAAQRGLAALAGEGGTVLVLLAGAAEVLAGRLSAGELLAVYALAGQVFGPAARLLQTLPGVAATRVAAGRLLDVLDADGRTRTTGADLTIAPGQVTALVGPSGSGKSTRLLALAEAGVGLLVPQTPVVFRGTVRSNLLYADPAAGPAQLWAALELADLAGFVRSLPDGLDAPVAERGGNLSGGQRQRLALARGLVAGPEVLLLDDPTSALDPATAARVWANVSAWAAGRTLVVAAHAVPPGCRPDRVQPSPGACG